MADLHPFSAVRPHPERVADVVCVPYDVINTKEAREMASGKPNSFLHVIRPEIDLPVETSEYAEEVYETGSKALQTYIHSADAVVEEEPALYVYRLVMNGRSQTGIFGCASVSDYDDNTILKHEKTRISKEDDRTRHIISQKAHAEPIMLTYRGSPRIQEITRETMVSEMLYDLETDDGVRHSIWRVANPSSLSDAFEKVEKLYVADGHHRCKSASRAREELSGSAGVSDEVNYFPAVFFPMAEMKILPYNRIIKRLPISPEQMLDGLSERCAVSASPDANPRMKGEIAISFGDGWYRVILPESENDAITATLDVGRLTEHILEPLLHITDPRTDSNIDFVGGIRGTIELERLLASGEAEMAISMYPTSIEELVDVSDAGLLMPPKSTWFEPKLRSGFLVHTF